VRGAVSESGGLNAGRSTREILSLSMFENINILIFSFNCFSRLIFKFKTLVTSS
jgi:hypothetical protein